MKAEKWVWRLSLPFAVYWMSIAWPIVCCILEIHELILSTACRGSGRMKDASRLTWSTIIESLSFLLTLAQLYVSPCYSSERVKHCLRQASWSLMYKRGCISTPHIPWLHWLHLKCCSQCDHLGGWVSTLGLHVEMWRPAHIFLDCLVLSTLNNVLKSLTWTHSLPIQPV